MRNAFERGRADRPGQLAPAAVLLAATIAITGTTCGVEQLQPEPSVVYVQVPYNQECEPVSTAQIADARTVLKQIAKGPSQLDVLGGIGVEHEQVVAKRYGLTIHDPGSFVGGLSVDQERGTNEFPFSSYFNAADSFVSQYGVNLRVINETDIKKIGADDSIIPTKKQLEASRAKRVMLETIYTIAEMPEQFVRKIGLTDIVLRTTTGNNVAYVESSVPGVVFVNVNNVSEFHLAKELAHELGHLNGERDCGIGKSIGDDPQYAAVNDDGELLGGDMYNSGGSPARFGLQQHGNIEGFHADNEKLFSAVSGPAASHTTQADREQFIKDIIGKEKNMKVLSGYSNNAVQEDKAEIQANLFGPYHYINVLNNSSETIREKTAILFARMKRMDPATANYFAAIALPIQSADFSKDVR